MLANLRRLPLADVKIRRAFADEQFEESIYVWHFFGR